jgi:hypothetical protein
VINMQSRETIYVWPPEAVDQLKTKIDSSVQVKPLELDDELSRYLIYDYVQGSLVEPQAIVVKTDGNSGTLVYNWILRESSTNKLPPEFKNELQAKLYNYYQEVYGEPLDVSSDIVKDLTEILNQKSSIKIDKSVVELLLKSIFSGTAFIYTPFKEEVVNLLKRIFELINEHSGNYYSYAINELDETKDYLIITYPIFEDIFTYENNLIFVYDFADIQKASEDLLFDLQVFCPVGGYIWKS